MRKLITAASLLLSCITMAQTPNEKPGILLDVCTIDSLTTPPFSQWFIPGYDSYQPNDTILTDLKKQKFNDITIEAFFGSWCGDSKRELPRFLQILHAISFPEKKLTIIGVGNGDSLYKQSPSHQEKEKGILRVPTFIVYKNGVEINRITEYPVESLEKDLLLILGNQPYTPRYQSHRFNSDQHKDELSNTGSRHQVSQAGTRKSL